jgi:predicted metal-dependent phosphoesterase TrpH
MHKLDLHLHSTCSDGTLTPFELITMARDFQLYGISITDHDTVNAYTPDVFQHAAKCKVELIPGVEFSTVYQDIGVHILGYDLDTSQFILRHFCQQHAERRIERNRMILSHLKRHGLYIDEEDLYRGKEKNQIIGRVHIAELLIKKGYVVSMKEAFKEWIGDEAPCFERGSNFSIEETIDIIHTAKGKAFLAHPHLIKEKKWIKKILQDHDFDGIECYYANFSKEDNQRWVNMAHHLGLHLSGGSDFHGEHRPFNRMGSAYVEKEVFESMRLSF